MNSIAYHNFWQQRCSREKKEAARHLKSLYKERGFKHAKLSTPNLWDAKETAAEALTGFYRTKSSPSLTSSDGALNGHLTLPKRVLRDRSNATTRSHSCVTSSCGSLCSECRGVPKALSSAGSALRNAGSVVGSRVDVASPFAGSAVGTESNWTSVSQRRPRTSSSLQHEVVKLVNEQMDTVVKPLQQQLREAKEAHKRAEQKLSEMGSQA
uniref:Uncharacterized protein n=1 Tax=Oxyrrhis marina TaxID=2969 RepID=A7WQM9_OXYMA|nr:unknown [Oxyrrhis marina]